MNPKLNQVFRPVLALAAALGLSACASVDTATFDNPDTPTRNLPVAASLNAPAPQVAPLETYTVTRVNVSVPRDLRVSEANRYLPAGDIVWREDPIGDRHEQVRVIVQNALTKGVQELQGERSVELDVVVSRFHALTEKARYTTGGVHAIQFTMRLRDAETGEPIGEPRFIKADFDALGGQAAVRAEARGITQKVRITDHLAYVIQQELGRPEGYKTQANGIVGALNQL